MPKVSESHREKYLIAICSIFVLVSDRVSKYLIVDQTEIGECHAVCPFFNITRVENYGVSFGMFRDRLSPFVLILLSLIVMVLLFLWAKKNKNYIFPTAMIISGAIGNVIDRIYYGAVIDFLDFYVSKYHWPAFNIADASIVIGTGILFFISYTEDKT